MGSADSGAARAPSPREACGAQERTSSGGVGRSCPSPNARLGRQPRLFSPSAKLGLTLFTLRSPNLLLFERGSQLPSLTLLYRPCGGVRACVFSGNFQLICVQTMAPHLCDLPAPGATLSPSCAGRPAPIEGCLVIHLPRPPAPRLQTISVVGSQLSQPRGDWGDRCGDSKQQGARTGSWGGYEGIRRER